MTNKDLILLENAYVKVLEEAKKKVNPFAVAKSIANETEGVVVYQYVPFKKKYGKNITSKTIKKKK